MRIQVTSEDMNLKLVLPTALIFSRGTAWIANHAGRKYAPEAMNGIAPEHLDTLFAEFRRIKKQYGQWELVEMVSADGEYIKITL